MAMTIKPVSDLRDYNKVLKECANGEPVSPWENGHCESFNAQMRDEFFNGELFCENEGTPKTGPLVKFQ